MSANRVARRADIYSDFYTDFYSDFQRVERVLFRPLVTLSWFESAPGPSSPRRQDPHAFPRVRTRSTKLVGSWLYLAPFRPWVTRFATRFTRFSLVQVDR